MLTVAGSNLKEILYMQIFFGELLIEPYAFKIWTF